MDKIKFQIKGFVLRSGDSLLAIEARHETT